MSCPKLIVEGSGSSSLVRRAWECVLFVSAAVKIQKFAHTFSHAAPSPPRDHGSVYIRGLLAADFHKVEAPKHAWT